MDIPVPDRLWSVRSRPRQGQGPPQGPPGAQIPVPLGLLGFRSAALVRWFFFFKVFLVVSRV